MSSKKRQNLIMHGIGLILLSAILFYYALSRPAISSELVPETTTVVKNTSEVSSLQKDVWEGSVEKQSNSDATQSSTYTQNQTAVGTTSTVQSTTATTNIQVSYPLNINTCTAEELMTVDGIGESRASAIIQYREYLGAYTSVEQIKDIKGIGDGIYADISPYLTV